MANVGLAATIKPALPRRVKVGIAATAVTLVILFYPGQMVLPMAVLSLFMPRAYGCGSFVGIAALLFFGLAYLISGVLVGLGIISLIAVALRNRVGLVGAVLIDAVAISLMLMTPLEFSPSQDSGVFGLDALFAACALIPATALVSLLSPGVFASWWHSGRPFIAAAAAAGLLLLPGAAGTVTLGYQIASVSSPPPIASPAASSHAAC